MEKELVKKVVVVSGVAVATYFIVNYFRHQAEKKGRVNFIFYEINIKENRYTVHTLPGKAYRIE